MNAFVDLIHRHQVTALPIAVVALGLAIVSILRNASDQFGTPTSPPRISQAYFFDLNTRELFTAPATERGPIETDSGDFEGRPAGVRAAVFSCGSCNDPFLQYVGWLEMPSDESATKPPHAETDGLICDPDGTEWYPIDSREATRIRRNAIHRCKMQGLGTLRYCHPPSKLMDE